MKQRINKNKKFPFSKLEENKPRQSRRNEMIKTKNKFKNWKIVKLVNLRTGSLLGWEECELGKLTTLLKKKGNIGTQD